MEDLSKFQALSETTLSGFIQKKENRRKITNKLWYLADHDLDVAVYLLYEVFVEYLLNPKLEDLFQIIKKGQLGWRSHLFERNKNVSIIQERDDFLMKPPEVEEGVIQCNRCKSKRTFSFSKQTRRADESATVFVQCANCNLSFKM